MNKIRISFNFIIIIIIMLMLLVTVSAVYIADFSAREKEQYEAVAVSRLDSAREEIIREIGEGAAAVNLLESETVGEATAVPEGWHAIAFAHPKENGYGINIRTSDGYGEYEVSPEEYGKLETNRFNMFFFSALPEKENIFSIYSKTVTGGIIILLQRSSLILNPDYIYDFKNLLLIAGEGQIFADYAGGYLGESATDFTPRYEDILNAESGTFYTGIGGENCLIVFSGIETKYGGGLLKIAGYVPSSEIDAFIGKGVVRLAMLIGIILAALSAAAAFFIRAYIKRYNELVCVKDKKTAYTVYTDKRGKIIRASSRFSEEFKAFEIFDKICEIGAKASVILEQGLPMTVTLNDKKGIERYITFLTAGTLKGYKLIGEEVTPLMRAYYDNLKLLSREEGLNIYNRKQFALDYEKAHETLHSTDGAFVLFELKNTGNYKTMFGMDFYAGIRKKYAEMLSETLKGYGETYFFDNEKFVLLVLGTENVKKFEENLQSLMKNINLPVAIGNNLVNIECLAGIVELDRNVKGRTIDEILSFASLSVAKAQQYKRLYSIYEYSKSGYILSPAKKLEIVKYIMENNQVEVFFQPQYSIKENKITGFEALCRLNGKYEKELKVFEFIEIAEQSGYMIQLGEYIYEKAFAFAKEIEVFNVSISLNVSPVQLLQAGFVKNFLDKFISHNLRPGSICLEITETFLMASFEEVVEKLEILSKNGINIHLDDFGVAYSSMLYLKKLPISTIKIDKEFVADIINNKYSRVICSKIIDITKELGLDSIAEGVETKPQLDCLRELGCKIIQGYLIGEAVNADKAKLQLTQYNIRRSGNV